jgi:Kef-type K+ transport system membrane component KefB
VSENPIIRDLGIIIVAAMLFVAVGKVARVPSIVSYMLAGLLLGPGLGLVQSNEPLEVIAEVGIALLLFLVGLELSFDKVRDVGRASVVTGALQVGLTWALGFGAALLLGHPAPEAAFLGAAVTFSSTVVVVKVLAEIGHFNAPYGRLAVGVLLVQDLAVVGILTFVVGLSGAESAGSTGAAGQLLSAFGGMAVLLAVTLLAAQKLLPRAFWWISRSQEALFIWSLAWCFLLILAAEALHLSLEIGAFLAGVSLAQMPLSHELRRRVHPLMNFFIAIFFVTLGIQMDLGEALSRWPTTLALCALVLLAKPFVIAWLLARQGYGERTALLTGGALGQISEFSFILGALVLSAGLVDESALSIVAAVGLITMGASSYGMLNSDRVVAALQRLGVARLVRASREVEKDEAEAPVRDHVIVIGMNALGLRIVRELQRRGEETLSIDTDPGKLEGISGRKLLGNVAYLSVLEEAGLPRAKLLVSALQIEDTNRLLAFRCAEQGVPSSIHAFDQTLVPELTALGASHVIESRSVGLERVLDALHDAGVYGS